MGKRANGEGSVTYVESRKSWVARFTYVDPVTGERKRSAHYGKTAAEARSKMNEARKRVESGAPVKDSTMTLGKYAESWSASTLLASGVKPTTAETYATLARVHIIGRSIGTKRLDTLKPSDVEAWLLEMQSDGKSESTRRQSYAVLRKILDAAQRDGLVARNVAASVKRPTVSRTESEHLTDTEIAALLDVTAETRYGALFALLAATGLRRGEGLALKWSDLDLDSDAPTLKVRGTLGRVGGSLTITAPKTDRSRRTVPLSGATVDLLRDRKRQQASERLAAGPAWQDTGLVFATEIGTPLDPRNALRAYQTAAKKIGRPGVGIHALRHSAATSMLSAGVPLHVVSTILGHSSVAITGDIYGHVVADDARTAIDNLAKRRAR